MQGKIFSETLLTSEKQVPGEVVHREVVDVEAGKVEGVEVLQVRRRQEHDHVPLGHEHHLAWSQYYKTKANASQQTAKYSKDP